MRGAVGVSDRGHTAASQLKPGDFDWDFIFGKLGARWFHTGGIFTALSDTTPAVALEAILAARKHGAVISYDLNYRPSLWKSIGGHKRAQEVNCEIARHVDVMLGNEEDFTACLGFKVDGLDADISQIDISAFKGMISRAVSAYPNLKIIATTLRRVRSATRNDWGAVCWCGDCFYEATHRPDLEILDRVGGGDSFASGFIYGLLEFGDPKKAVEYGAAHGALAMTTPGDTSMASLREVEALVGGGSARVQR
jgi:2-dehydro-3-deoxygluconokinase